MYQKTKGDLSFPDCIVLTWCSDKDATPLTFDKDIKKYFDEIKIERLWLELYRLLAGYGERPLNTVSISGLIVFVFTLIYWEFGCLKYTTESPTLFQQFIDADTLVLSHLLLSGWAIFVC